MPKDPYRKLNFEFFENSFLLSSHKKDYQFMKNFKSYYKLVFVFTDKTVEKFKNLGKFKNQRQFQNTQNIDICVCFV